MKGPRMDGTTILAELSQEAETKKPVLAVRLGRGRTGGSTCLDLIIQRGRKKGRRVMVGDGDKRNPTLSTLYPPDQPDGATQPETDETADVKDWITAELGRMVTEHASL